MRCLVRLLLLGILASLVVWMLLDLSHGSHIGPSLSFSLPAARPSSASVAVAAGATKGTSILGRPSLSASFIDAVLALAHSPAQGTGQTFYKESVQTGIDDAYPLAIFWHESNFGLAGAAVATRNVGNIVCAGFSSCFGRFRSYASWSAGVSGLYQLLVNEYLPRHLSTLESILHVYAPASDGNSPTAYVDAVKASVAYWRQEVGKGVH